VRCNRYKHLRFSLALSVLLSLFYSRLVSAAPKPPLALFITSAGDESCAEVKNPNFPAVEGPWRTRLHVKLHDELIPALTKKNASFSFAHLSTCYGNTWVNSRSLKTDLRAWDSISGKTQKFLLGDFWALPKGKHYAWAADWIASYAQKMLAGIGANVPVYIMAHSYGAWTDIQVAKRLRENSVNVRVLFTMDPISPNFCSQRIYLDSLPKIPEGCREFPKDYSSGDQTNLLSSLNGRWWNFYEEQHIFLHSGPAAPLETVGQETKIRVDKHFDLFHDQHSLLAGDEAVWAAIDATVLADWR